ncbi:hypothetical protein CKG00_01185 [Morganella morganii]|uniref:NlpC/P60 domain-containing protein n=1 Tax=Morganella morganii TaxID=582 RepID=A0A433ZST0_MORMO|nr:C40 family peptidase [Morganella morganii]RUT65171.1 hypothetical protein CKG00_01185 [Morganella morganii]
MTTDEFTDRMVGVPWVNRACSFTECDCWGLVLLYYRHVMGREIHSVTGYAEHDDFVTCFNGVIVPWVPIAYPEDGCMFVAYDGSQPVHVGIVTGSTALHSRGENGHVRIDRLSVLGRLYTKLEFYRYGDD